MRNEMIFRYSLDTYIYAIDQGHVLVVLWDAWKSCLDAGYSSDFLHNPQFWLLCVGQPGVYIQEPPYPPAFGYWGGL